MEDAIQEILRKMDAIHSELANDKESNRNTIRRLEMQIGQIASEVQGNRHGKLPTHPEQAKAVHTLRSGKTVHNGIVYNEEEDTDHGVQMHKGDSIRALRKID